MPKGSLAKVSQSGTYVVKAAESRSSKVISKPDGRVISKRPTMSDKRLANALLRSKRG
jgi:hypothetical protein